MKDREKLIELVETTSNELKLAIRNDIVLGLSQELILIDIDTRISKFEDELKTETTDKEFIEEQIKGLRQLSLIWFNFLVFGLRKIAKENNSEIIAQGIAQYKPLKKDGTPYKMASNGGMTISSNENEINLQRQGVTNLRELMTNPSEGGVGRYDDYGAKLRKQIEDFQQQYAVDPASFTDAKGNKKNLRAMAEIKVRYDMISDDLKGKDVKYVVATSHPNASERCSWWQGKIFLVDLDIELRGMHEYDKSKAETFSNQPLGKIDGRDYYSLKKAVECGFLSYNCQHRLIKYYKGIKPPKYSLIEVEKKRNLTTYQRSLENKVRQTKMIEKINGRSSIIMRKNLNTGQMEDMKASDYSKMLQDYYKKFCQRNGLTQYTWRLRITKEERG